jgi:glycosyltransferase involved in cell wall biosynthesis
VTQFDKPLVSIVMPSYNYGHLINLAITSVVNQNYENWELIIIDNSSKDNTSEVVSQFLDSRIKLIQVNNSGVIAFSRNLGIKHSNGEFIAFLDSDDIWYPDKLRLAVDKLLAGYDLVCNGELWINHDPMMGWSRKVVYGPESKANFKQLLFKGNCISTSAVVVRKDALLEVGLFDESVGLITAEDYHLWMKIAQKSKKITFLKDILGEYTIHPHNSSAALLNNMMATKRVVDQLYIQHVKGSLINSIRLWRRHAIIEYGYARGLQNNQKYSDAARHLISAILKWPLNLKFYVALVYVLIKKPIYRA